MGRQASGGLGLPPKGGGDGRATPGCRHRWMQPGPVKFRRDASGPFSRALLAAALVAMPTLFTSPAVAYTIPHADGAVQVTATPNPVRAHATPAIAVDPKDRNVLAVAEGDARSARCGLWIDPVASRDPAQPAAAYASEIYPTRVRGRGTGLAAAGTKLGGVMILAAVAASLAAPSISVTALLGAVPIIVAIVLLVAFGVETRKKGLETITAEELAGRVVQSA